MNSQYKGERDVFVDIDDFTLIIKYLPKMWCVLLADSARRTEVLSCTFPISMWRYVWLFWLLLCSFSNQPSYDSTGLFIILFGYVLFGLSVGCESVCSVVAFVCVILVVLVEVLEESFLSYPIFKNKKLKVKRHWIAKNMIYKFIGEIKTSFAKNVINH